MSEVIEHAVPFPLPPTSGPPAAAPEQLPPPPPAPPPAPAADGVEALQAKIAEQAHVIELAKTRVETLGAEKLAALQQVNDLRAELEAAQARIASLETAPPAPASTLEELAQRVAALEALVAPPRVA